MIENIDRMLVCDVCGKDACCGFGVTLDGLGMGDQGTWRCAEHHPHRKQSYSREEWAQAREVGKLYPDSSEGEWVQLRDIVAGIERRILSNKAREEARARAETIEQGEAAE